jgi:hypothetical protein
VGGHPPATLDLVVVQCSGPLRRRVVPHPVERPDQVDGSRARTRQHLVGGIEVLRALGRQRVPVGSCDADRRRAAHSKRPNRLGDLRRRPAAKLDLLVWKPTLVEEDHCVIL